jgi:hypothetical protein
LPRRRYFARHPDRFAIVERNPDISKHEAREIMRDWRAEQAGTATPAAQSSSDENDDLIEEEDDTEPTPEATTSTRRKTKGAKKTTTEEQAEFNESKRLLSNQVELANDMIGVAEGRKKCPAEQLRNLGKAAAMVPASLATMQKAGEEWLAYVDWLKELAAEVKETAIREGRIRTSPNPAPSEPAQVSA